MKHILIIDDEDDIRDVAQVALETIGGWRVSTASTGPEGLAQMQADPPDVVLLDVMMPDMDGIEVFKRMRAESQIQDIPVLLMTAKTQAADQQRFLSLGVTAIITKPFKVMLLADQIAEILDW
ncbi:response regulator [Leptolyngbyaceae cyanobacterium CCMR0082]|uniref:Response regulator n=1 Tax=Adonisia turfae CCMR0082 TaxID=2304604 RepID=A0A6M0SEK3_9CYAN|nr:response regulator [Adonisia turfae]MDV3350185.1 response regulator [Leptothoe sp. LEGE 181152]NEZ66463.1 response regulator [Adonisia turfae CCMR0082]